MHQRTRALKRVMGGASSAGFTLIELLVVLAIIITITGVVLTNQTSFNKSLVLSNTAYDIALSIRDAQTFGLSSRVVGAVSNVGYGINFAKATPSTFTLFTDTYPATGAVGNCHPTSDPTAPSAQPGNCAYDPSQAENVKSYTIGNNIRVSDFCAYASGAWACANSLGSTLASLDVVFARPNADAFMSTNGAYSATFPVTAACITLSSPQGGNKYISIASSGSIVANATSCP